jgi:tetratricopeptide (TPR) repeat protein
MRRRARSDVRLHGLLPGAWRVALAAALLAWPVLAARGIAPQSSSAHALESVQDSDVLEPGRVLRRESAGGQKHSYQIAVPQGEYASVLIEPLGMEVVARLLAPDGSAALEAHSEGRPAHLALAAERSATYRIEVESEYPRAPAGSYTIRLEVLRPAVERDRLLYQADSLFSESRRLYRVGAYERAQATGERALELREKVLGPAHAEVAASLNAVGLTCTARNDYARAETLFQRALAITAKALGDEDPSVAEVLDNLARNDNAAARYADAERLAKQALGIREKAFGPESFPVAASLGSLGDVYLARGEPAEAQRASDRALEIAGKSYGPDDLPYAAFLSRSGRVLADQGNYSRAEELHSQALDITQRIAGKDSLPAADSLQGLASLSLLKGDNVRSEELHQRVLEIKERILGRDHLDVGLVLHNLGTIHYRRRDYAAAEALYTRSLAIKEKILGPTHPLVAYTLNNLGLLYWKLGDYPKAQDFFRRTLELGEKAYGPDSLRVASALGNLGIIAKETGDYDRAEAYYRRTLAIREKAYGPRHPQVGVTVESLGILYRDKGDYAGAEPLFLRSLQITEESLGPDHPDVARNLSHLAQLYFARGDAASALQCLQRVSAIEEKNLPLNLAVGSERQKLAYFDPLAHTLEKIISFQVRQDSGEGGARDLAATTLLQRKGRVLDAMADSLAALRRRSSAADQASLDQLSDVTSRLATLVLNGPQKASLVEHQERIRTLTEQREKLEDQVNRQSAGFYQRADAVTLAAVKSAIPENAALVEFAVYRPYDPKTSVESTKSYGDPRYVVYVILSRGDARWSDLGSAKEIDRAVDAFRQVLRDPERHDAGRAARALDEKIMRPVRALAGDARHLLLSPDGQLDLIPFEALVDEQGDYLVSRYLVTYLTTGRDLARMRVARSSASGPLVVANPFFGEPTATRIASAKHPKGNAATDVTARRSITTGEDLSSVYFAPLAGTVLEASTIQSLFPEAEVLTGQQANKAALKGVNAPRILHIATHGFFLQDAAADGATKAAAAPPAAGTRAVAAMVKT